MITTVERLQNASIAPLQQTYTWRDSALYALGVGAKRGEAAYLVEGPGCRVLPTFSVVASQRVVFDLLRKVGCDLRLVVHRSERIVAHASLAPAGTLSTTGAVRGVYDMDRFALLVVDTRSEDETGRLVAEATSSILLRDLGGFHGLRAPSWAQRMDRPPRTSPAFAIEERTAFEQALLYRLSGDENPLHADDDFARRAGFARGAILHGLCTFGFMARHVAKAVCGGDSARIRILDGQFRRPVWPGETLITEGWNVAADTYALQVRAKERNEVVLSSGSTTVAQ